MQQNLLLHLFCDKEKVKVKVFACKIAVHHIIFGFSVIIEYNDYISAHASCQGGKVIFAKSLKNGIAMTKKRHADELITTKMISRTLCGRSFLLQRIRGSVFKIVCKQVKDDFFAVELS